MKPPNKVITSSSTRSLPFPRSAVSDDRQQEHLVAVLPTILSACGMRYKFSTERRRERAECSYRSPISRPIHHNQNVDSSCELRGPLLSSSPRSKLCTRSRLPPPPACHFQLCFLHFSPDCDGLTFPGPACQLRGIREQHGAE